MLLDLVERRARSSTADPQFRADVIAGLGRRPRAIPARWFYDRRGSELFEKITKLPEYYPTRTETRLLERHAGEVAEIAGRGRAVIEFGSGSSAKTPHLLHAVAPSIYVPIDISGEFLRASAAELAKTFPGLPIEPIEADFLRPIALPATAADTLRLGFFPGSTIGNMEPSVAVDLLRAMSDTLGPGAQLLIGMDRIKGEDILLPAYDDAAGVTAAFNLNLLHRINRELEGTISVEAFRHRALWNDLDARIEMHLEAVRPIRFEVCDQCFEMKQGETIHTENSHKYSVRSSRLMLRSGGWRPLREWTDQRGFFTMVLAESAPTAPAP